MSGPVATPPAGDDSPDSRRLRQRAALWRRLGLRGRVTVMFGLGALLLSVAMGGISYFTTRHFLVAEREIGVPPAGLRERLLDPELAP